MTVRVGDKVRVRHIGVEKVGTVTKVTATFVWVEVECGKVGKRFKKVAKFQHFEVKEA